MKKIDRANLVRADGGVSELLGRGAFGTCRKRTYRGIEVAVKEFALSEKATTVKMEAGLLTKVDHPGNFCLKLVEVLSTEH